jgi:hypothetical protein
LHWARLGAFWGPGWLALLCRFENGRRTFLPGP